MLPSGVRILSEEIPGAPSVAIAASVAVGSRDESEGTFGATHFLEHLLFKGTPTRSARDISVAFDSVGGSSNAATAKEYTSYYARVMNSALPLALDVILDMFTSAKIEQHDFDLEKTVILEELAMGEDDPEDLAHEALASALLPDHELGRPIGGTKETILAVTREQVVEHYQKHYVPENLVVTAAGGVSHEKLVQLVEQELAKVGWLESKSDPNPRRSQEEFLLPETTKFSNLNHDFAQANLLLGYQSIRGMDPDRYALGLMTTILGGGMSSRLYQEIREERGLAYSTYSYQQGYSDAGYFGLYAGTNPENSELVIQLMKSGLESIAEHGVSKDEFDLALGSLTGGLALRYESSLARMNRLLAAEIGSGEFLSTEQILGRFNEVDISSIQAVAARVAAGRSSLVVVGPDLQALEHLA
ncbi:MAG: pitrilysin family protein [Aquiluna sp.]|nr:pitrilysin family protein [Aquiluna sp.]